MSLRDTMARHARGMLTRQDHFGEVITYNFNDDGHTTRQVRAVVDRLDLEPADPSMTRAVAKIICNVAIPRDAEVGILVVTPGDTVTLPLRLGEPDRTARVRRIISQDEGMFLLEVAG